MGLGDDPAPYDSARQFIVQRRQRAIWRALNREGMLPLHDKKILELGCGDGNVLRELQMLGAAQHHLYGVDIDEARIRKARVLSPAFGFARADAAQLPFRSGRFHLAVQFTLLSSVLDETRRQAIATQMLRALRPDGIGLWYDFWLNPTNKRTRGVRPAEIRRLFPGCELSFERLTLAPPITRRLVGRARWACTVLESLRVLCTHYLATIRRKDPACTD